MPELDVIIIGAGPAGCAAALTSVNAGLSVLIITDKTDSDNSIDVLQEPVESLHPGVSSLLKQIGAGGVETPSIVGYYEGIMAGEKYNSLGHDENGPWKGMHINRGVFDREILKVIRHRNVKIEANTRVLDFILEKNKVVGIRTANGENRASFIIDASGKTALGGKKLNFKKRYYSPPLLCWSGMTKMEGAFSFQKNVTHFIPAKHGWTWLAPIDDNYCAWTCLTTREQKNIHPPEELRGGNTSGKILVANLRWRLYKPVCREGIVLCGDAAGVLDPAAGQGIFNALRSGVIAGQVVSKCIGQPAFAAYHLAQYEDWFGEQYEEKVGRLRGYYGEMGIELG